MRVLTVNCGTRSLRFDVVEPGHGFVEPVSIVRGLIDGFDDGTGATARLTVNRETTEQPVAARDHAEAFVAAMALLEAGGYLEDVEAVCHRVLQGGLRCSDTALIDADVIKAIEEASGLAPMHNRAALEAIAAAQSRFPDLPMVATFDTAYFANLPEVAWRYALPRQLTDDFAIRRFGGQGLAHRYMVERYRSLHPHRNNARLITLHLGIDSSATASRNGQPLDTSMGFTLAEGLIMGTRSGDLDPAIPLILQTKGGLSTDEVWRVLNRESGLLALSGSTADFIELLRLAADRDENAMLAFEAFCLSVRKYVGAYAALLGGADAIIFGGGIGQHSPEVRLRVCEGLEWMGVRLDRRWNLEASGDMMISSDDSPTEIWVMPVDESAVMLQETLRVLPRSN